MDNGELKQCGICGDVFACGGYSVTLTDNTDCLQELKYTKICPVCYGRILRSLVILQAEGSMRSRGKEISDRCSVCRGAQHTEADGQRMGEEGKVESS